jgi:recombination protein RecT
VSTTSLEKIAGGEKPATPIAKFAAFMDKLKPQMALALPKHMNADRMARLVLTAFSTNKDLQQCTFNSIASSIMTATQLGLEPGINGQCYLIPYFDRRNNQHICTLIPGWKGLVDLVARSGRATVWTGVVFPGDRFDYELGDSPFCKHKPSGDDDDGAEFTHVYAIGRVRDSTMPVIEVWTRSKVAKHLKQYNKVGDRHYAKQGENNFEMYARKVALLQVLKYMPASIELANAIEVSNAVEAGNGAVLEGDYVTVTPEEHVDQDSGEVTGGNTGSAAAAPPPPAQPDTAFNYAAATKKVKAAKDRDALDLMVEEYRSLPDGEPKESLIAAYHLRVAELAAT